MGCFGRADRGRPLAVAPVSARRGSAQLGDLSSVVHWGALPAFIWAKANTTKSQLNSGVGWEIEAKTCKGTRGQNARQEDVHWCAAP